MGTEGGGVRPHPDGLDSSHGLARKDWGQLHIAGCAAESDVLCDEDVLGAARDRRLELVHCGHGDAGAESRCGAERGEEAEQESSAASVALAQGALSFHG